MLTTRAGLSPNKPHPVQQPHGFCALPFTDLYITYTGRVNLCCFDAHGRVPMGSVMTESLLDIWESSGFVPYRRSLLVSTRAGLTPCECCDYDGFRELVFHKDHPATRFHYEEQLEAGGYAGQLMHNPVSHARLHATPEEYFARDTTTINHFHEKLLLLKDRMNTSSARRIAERRHEFLLDFLREFSAEWNGCDVADSIKVSDLA